MISLEYLRQFRLGGYAMFDLSLAFLGIALLSPLLSKLFLKIRFYVPKLDWVFLTLPIGILVHLAFGNITPMTRDFFDLSGHWWLKAIILLSLFLGVRGMRVIKK